MNAPFKLLLAVLSLLCTQHSVGAQTFSYPISPDRILLRLMPGTPATRLDQILAETQSVLHSQPSAALHDHMHIAWLSPGTTAQQAAASMAILESHPEIQYAHPFIDFGRDLRGMTNRVLLKLHAGHTLQELSSELQALGLSLERLDPYLPRLFRLLQDKSATSTPIDAALALAQHPAVQYADIDYVLNPVVHSNDPLFNTQWALENTGSTAQGNGTADADMDVPDAWVTTRGDSAIRIAIIDSGTDTLHPDLRANLLPGYDATGGGSQGYPNTSYPQDAHGTNCAGIVAAVADNNLGIAGVCPECRIMPVKVFYYIGIPFIDTLPFASGTAMADAISWSWQQGDADVLSNSWGLFDALLPGLPGGTQIVDDAIALALDSARGGKGGLLFFSSGNDGGSPLWPGRAHGCFSVNATTMCDERKHPGSCDGDNWEGNWGDSLDIGAPGVSIAATDMTGSLGYEPGDYTPEFGGTSAACPNAAGVMGLVLSVAPWLSLEQAHYVLESTCDRVGGYAYANTTSSGTHGPELGHGRLNANAAVTAAATITAGSKPVIPHSPSIRAGWDPQSASIRLLMDHLNQGTATIDLRDVQGRLIQEWIIVHPGQESYSTLLPLRHPQIAAGAYLLHVRVKGQDMTVKMLLIN